MARCLWTDSCTPTFRRPRAVAWASSPTDSDTDTAARATVDTPRSAERIDSDRRDLGCDDAT